MAETVSRLSHFGWLGSASGGASGRLLRVATFPDPPMVTVRQMEDGSYEYDGYLYHLWSIIAQELGLRYEITPHLAESGYGSLAPNGTWTGMVGELVYGRADVALSWLIVSPDRVKVIDYIDAVPIAHAEETFYVRRGSSGDMPGLSLAMFAALLKPLQLDVWWLLLALLLLVAVVLYSTVRFNHARAETRRTTAEMTWGACLLASLRTMLYQGWDRTPDSLAARATALASWSLGILIFTYYTANMISHQTISIENRPISSLQEFSEQDGWLLAVSPYMGTPANWKRSEDEHERKLYERMITGDGYIRLDMATNAHRITEPRVMTFSDIRYLFDVIGSDACNLVHLFHSPPPKTYTYMAVAKGQRELLKQVNRVMLKLTETGVIARLHRMWLPSSENMFLTRCSAVEEFEQLSFSEALPVLAVVPIGVFCSTILLAMEYVVFMVTRGNVKSYSVPSLPF